MRAVIAVLIGVLAVPVGATGQGAVSPAGGGGAWPIVAEPLPITDLPVSLEHIRRDLKRPDILRSATGVDVPIFRVEVQATLPRFIDFIGGNDALKGPVPYGGLTHHEFLQMVTPPQAQPFGAFTGGALVQVLATSMLSGLAVQGAVKAGSALVNSIKTGVYNREVEAARAEIREIVAELARRKAEAAAKQEREPAQDAAAATPTDPGKPLPAKPDAPAAPVKPPVPDPPGQR